MTSMHKKPYEIVIFGKSTATLSTAPISNPFSPQCPLLPGHKQLTDMSTATINPVSTFEYIISEAAQYRMGSGSRTSYVPSTPVPSTPVSSTPAAESRDEGCIPCAKRLKKDGSPIMCFSIDGDQVELQCTPIVQDHSLCNIFPYHNAILCVPSKAHSQKPYLGGNLL